MFLGTLWRLHDGSCLHWSRDPHTLGLAQEFASTRSAVYIFKNGAFHEAGLVWRLFSERTSPSHPFYISKYGTAYYFGIDINESPLQAAYDNVRTAGLEDRIGLLHASAKKLPLLSESVDIIISDIPFGKKFISIKEDLPGILHEMERVLRIGGTIVLLLSLELYKQVGLHVSGILNNARPPTAATGETSGAEMMNIANYEERQENSSNNSSGSQRLRLRCLLPVESHSVSLGVTEACILKCKKIATPPVQ